MKSRAALHLLGVVLAAGLTTTSAASPAAAQTIEYQGSAIIHDFSAPCQQAGWYATSQAVFMRYYPANVGDNPASASFSFNQSLGAMGFHQPDGGFDSTFRPVEGQAIFGSFWTFDNARARFTRQVPQRLTAGTTGPVRIAGQIRNFVGARQCNVRFEAVLVRVP
ncbi:MAG: hypothetical protein JJU15_19240 [Pararhodobacter sp.]|nr:hypothetical protein [Pararhodobacter sp.]